MACMDSVSAAIVMKLEQSRAELQQTRSATAQVYPQLCAVYKATRIVLHNPVRSFGIQGTCASRYLRPPGSAALLVKQPHIITAAATRTYLGYYAKVA